MKTRNRHDLVQRTIVVGFALILGLVGSAVAQSTTAAFTATMKEMNPQLTDGNVSGQAILTVDSGLLHIDLIMKGLPAGMRLAHIHGFMTDEVSTCPAATADTNGDGIIDLLETEPTAGTTLIPFNGDPAGLQILSDTYPVAGEDGLLVYDMTVPLDKLDGAMKDTYKIDDLTLGNRVIFVHGVAEGATLPDTVQSLPGVPATVTVPIACGEVRPF